MVLGAAMGPLVGAVGTAQCTHLTRTHTAHHKFHTPKYTHAHTHSNTQAHTHKHRHTHTQTHRHTHTNTGTHTHSNTQSHTHVSKLESIVNTHYIIQ